MMQECPRCGFSQPKDKYCANCGLNIDSYHPEPTSLVSRILSSTWFQMAIVVTTIAILVSILYWKQSDDISQFTSSNTPYEAVQKDATSPIEQKPTTADAKKVQKETSQVNPSNQTKEASTHVATSNQQETDPPNANTIIEEKSKPPSQLVIEYAELPQTAIQNAMDTGTIVGNDAGVSALLIPWKSGISEWIKIQNGQVLPGRKYFDIKSETPITSQYLEQVDEATQQSSFIFQLSLFPSTISIESVELDIASEFSIPNSSVPEQQANFSGKSKLGHILLLVGLLPTIDPTSLPEIDLRGSPLEVFYSDSYSTRNSDFVTIIRIK